TLPGWRSYHVAFLAEGPPGVVVSHRSAVGAWELALFFATLVMGGRLRDLRGQWWIVALAILAIACLILPDVFAPIATGAFLGLLFAPIVRLRPTAHRNPSAPSSALSWSRQSSVGVTSLLLCFCM